MAIKSYYPETKESRPRGCAGAINRSCIPGHWYIKFFDCRAISGRGIERLDDDDNGASTYRVTNRVKEQLCRTNDFEQEILLD